MSTDKVLARVDALIAKGRGVLQTHRPNPPGMIGFPTLDSGSFSAWKSQALAFLHECLGEGHVYAQSFADKVKQGYQSQVSAGVGILLSAREDLAAGHLGKSTEQAPLVLIEQICSRFHLVARQLRSRHGLRSTLDVTDEYDVQDLMHGLLCLHFDDIRPEEYTPSYAGKSTRMDFLLKQESIVLELKMTRPGLGPKELSSQLIEDIERYKAHPDCQALICFAYDPAGLIPNPRGIESDLKRDENPFPVRVLIRP